MGTYYLQVYQSLGEHPKTQKAAHELGIQEETFLGHLLRLWWWALDYAPEGTLSGYEDWELEKASRWTGQAGVFVAALSKYGFVDGKAGKYALHDWGDYSGKAVRFRVADRERKRKSRELQGILGQSMDSPEDVTRTTAGQSSGCPEKRVGLSASRLDKTRLDKTRREDENAKNGSQDWVGAYVDAWSAVGQEPTKSEKSIFGKKVKEIVDLDPLLMQDTISRMVRLQKSPGLVVHVYKDCKTDAEKEVFEMRGGTRRVR